jgi:hypothetical protein
VHDPLGLLLDRVHHLWERMRGHGGQDPAEEVEILATIGVPNATTFAAHQFDGLFVVQRQPRRHHRPMSLQELGVDAGHPPSPESDAT